MNVVRTIIADEHEIVEIIWQRAYTEPGNPHLKIDTYAERHTCPPKPTWQARTARTFIDGDSPDRQSGK